ncbi:MAG: alpha/beta hydrolase [Deltaproteobacteria bacterium]|nr:MAG: alpha/beta hydrolase [Deltaproteobacteria bacterium]
MRWSLEHALGHAIMVRRFGSGPEILWIHGLGEQSQGLEAIASHAAFAGYSHVLVDLPGYGRSPWPEHVDHLERLAERLADWIGNRQPAIVGHSMGGVLAQLIAERTAVRAVVDVEGNLSIGDCTFSAKAAAYDLDNFLAFGYSAMRAQVYDDGRTDMALRVYHAAMVLASPHAFHRHALDLVAMSEPETLGVRLAALRAPVLFVAGVPDGMSRHSRDLLDRHGLRWAGIEPAGHWVHIDQPERFAAEVAGFLREVMPLSSMT